MNLPSSTLKPTSVLNDEMNRRQSILAVIDGSSGAHRNSMRGVTSFRAYSSLIVLPASLAMDAMSPDSDTHVSAEAQAHATSRPAAIVCSSLMPVPSASQRALDGAFDEIERCLPAAAILVAVE